MPWPHYLLASALVVQGPAAKPLRFDLTVIPATRDSFVFLFDRKRRGFAVWQYEIRGAPPHEEVKYTEYSQLEPLEEEYVQVVLDRATGAPISSFHHVELFSPQSDTVLVEHSLRVENGRVVGLRRVGTKDGKIDSVRVNTPLPPGTVWYDYQVYAAAATNAAPGDSLTAPDYIEDVDSLGTLTLVAGEPETIRVPAGRFAVLPLRSGEFVVYVTQDRPRRVVKGATESCPSPGERRDCHVFSFELVHSGAVVPSQP